MLLKEIKLSDLALTNKTDLVEIGILTKPHGLKGEIKLTPTQDTIKLVESVVKNEFLSKIPVVILEEIILKKITGMNSQDISHRTNLKYFQDKNLCSKELNNNNWNYAITVPPLSVDEIFKVTKSGAIFPQKSTYFYPKAPTGLVMRSMEK